jgi:hypothetical protein
MQSNSMLTKELAEKIIRNNIEWERLSHERFDIQKQLNIAYWDAVCTEAMKFLIERRGGSNGN